MDFFENILQPLTIFMPTVAIFIFIGIKLRVNKLISFTLYLWHSVMCIMIWYLISTEGGDAHGYYHAGISGISIFGGPVGFGTGTEFVESLTYVFVQYLGFSFNTLFVVYGFFGAIGVLIFASTILDLSKVSLISIRPWHWVIIFLPSLSLWTSTIGKDGLSTLAVALFIKGSMCGRRRENILFLSVLIMFLVRPHMALALVMGLVMMYVVQRQMSFVSIAMLTIISSLGVIFLAPVVATTIGIADLSVNSVSEFAEKRGSFASSRDDAAFWYQQPVPVRMLMTIFYPTPLSASGIVQMIVALENLILLTLTGILLWHSKFMSNLHREDFHLLFYFMISWIILGSIMYNTGLASRQKWMFVPILLFLAMKYMGRVPKSAFS